MAHKFVAILFAFIAVASAGPLAKEIVYPDAPAEYDFKYDVKDVHTGDVKSQQETRKGDHVVGQYTLIDADGYQRIVDYQADEHNGFTAIVRREPLAGYKTAPVLHKTVIAAPVTKFLAAPVVSIAKYVAAPLATKIIATAPKYLDNHSQVSFHGPSHNYHY